MTSMRRYMDAIQTLTEAPAERFLFHFTDQDSLDDILETGVRPLSYWGTMAVAMWYRSSLYRGDKPVILRVPLISFDHNYLEPDMRGLQDPPPSSVIEMTEEDVSEAWDTIENPNWEDCLNLIGSVSYRGIVRVTEKNIFSTTDANGR